MSGPRLTYEGYLKVDHSASPGLPADVARRAGYDPALAGEGKVYETATMSCRHCRVSVVKNPLRTRERARCAKCNWGYVCDPCAAAMASPDYDHTPFEALIDRVFEAATPRGMICI